MTQLLKKLGSLSFTVWLSVLLMLILIVSTVLESIYGTAFAQKTFYQTRWFDFFLSLLCVNIICATILRFPIRKCQIGFLITHIGIVGLLVGALITRVFGIDGQLMVFEGKSANQLSMGGYQLDVDFPGKQKQSFDLRLGQYSLALDYEELKLSVNVLESATEEIVFAEGDEKSSDNSAINVSVQSEKMGLDHSFWLMEKHPADARAHVETIGPVKIFLRKKTGQEDIRRTGLRIVTELGDELAFIDLEGPLAREIVLGNGLRVTDLKYIPFAKVVNGKIANVPEGKAFNPAADFNIVDEKGNVEHYLKFAYFPDFESIHSKATVQGFGVVVEFEAPEPGTHDSYAGTALTFFVSEDGQLTYRVNTGGNDSDERNVVQEKWFSTGLTDIRVRVNKALKKAVLSTEVVEASGSDDGVFAVEVFMDDKERKHSQWLTEGQRIGFHVGDENIYLSLNSKKMNLPFQLYLKDFRKIEYPGTNNPSAFESDVILRDKEENVEIHKTISMNKPLDYKGYRIFQSSYIQDTGNGEASIFTVAKNPGIAVIYLSSLIIFIGAILQFYVKPRFSLKSPS